MILHLKNENLKEEIKEGKVILDFYATWCGPCKMLSPMLESIANERSEIKVIKIDIDEHEDIAREYGIMSVPTLIYFNNGKEISKTNGFLPKEVILEQFEK